jgi:hypothetical protein
MVMRKVESEFKLDKINGSRVLITGKASDVEKSHNLVLVECTLCTEIAGPRPIRLRF